MWRKGIGTVLSTHCIDEIRQRKAVRAIARRYGPDGIGRDFGIHGFLGRVQDGYDYEEGRNNEGYSSKCECYVALLEGKNLVPEL